MGGIAIHTRTLLNLNEGSNWYARILNATTLQIWDGASKKLSSDVSWADSALSMTNATATIGGWTLTLPEELPAGMYYIIFYQSASPSSSDSPDMAVYIEYQRGVARMIYNL